MSTKAFGVQDVSLTSVQKGSTVYYMKVRISSARTPW